MDWFAGTIFLMMNGDAEKAWQFLYRFSCIAASGYMWTYRLHSSVSPPLYCALYLDKRGMKQEEGVHVSGKADVCTREEVTQKFVFYFEL